MLAVVGKCAGAVDADVPGTQIAAQMTEYADFKIATVRGMSQVMRATHYLAPAFRGKGQIDFARDPFALFMFVLKYHIKRIEQAAIFRCRVKLQYLHHPEHRGAPATVGLP